MLKLNSYFSFNLANSQKMLDEYIKWREEIKLDTYDFSEIFKILFNDKVFEIIGRDKADRPIIYGRGQYFLPAQMYFFSFIAYFYK